MDTNKQLEILKRKLERQEQGHKQTMKLLYER